MTFLKNSKKRVIIRTSCVPVLPGYDMVQKRSQEDNFTVHMRYNDLMPVIFFIPWNRVLSGTIAT